MITLTSYARRIALDGQGYVVCGTKKNLHALTCSETGGRK